MTPKEALANQKARRSGVDRSLLIIGAGAVAALVPLMGGFESGILAAVAIYFVWITLAVSWNIAGGYAGLLNLGLVAFFGLGAVVGGAALQSGLPFVAVVAAAGLAGAALASFLVPTFRLKSFYFAMGTFVVPYIVKPLVEVVSGSAVFRVPSGDILSVPELYYSGLALALSALLGVQLLMKSKVGFALRALGSDEVASSSLGVNVALYKAVALVVSGMLASLAGLYYLEIAGTADTTIFQNLSFSLLPLFMVIIGGTGTLDGPVVGALTFSVLNYFVTAEFPGSTLDVFVLSLAVVAIALFRPRGIVPRRLGR